MIDFNFVSPTKIIFGHGAESKIGALLKDYGFKNVLLVYGSASIKLNGLYGKVVAWLDEADIHHEEISGVRANPSKELVTQGVALALAKKCDAILAIGGGSVIDTAKSIGVGYYYKGDPFDFNLHVAVPKKSLPVGVILTIASAGSELSNSCVISDDTSHIKQGFNSDIVRPLFAIEDPELTYSVPAYQTACGVSDIMLLGRERLSPPTAVMGPSAFSISRPNKPKERPRGGVMPLLGVFFVFGLLAADGHRLDIGVRARESGILEFDLVIETLEIREHLEQVAA
jgi:Uncharacterized oxidoreductases, Fe-dependent alcohol dehydrogenase family